MQLDVRIRRLVVSWAIALLLLVPVFSVAHGAFIAANAECFRAWGSTTLTWGGTGDTTYAGNHTLRVRLWQLDDLKKTIYDYSRNWDINSTWSGVSGNGDWNVYARMSRDGFSEVATDHCQVT